MCRGCFRRCGPGDVEGGVDALVIETEDLHADLDGIGVLHFLEEMHVHLHRVKRRPGARAIGGVESEAIHERVGGLTGDERVVGITHVPVVVDPFRPDRRLVDRYAGHVS